MKCLLFRYEWYCTYHHLVQYHHLCFICVSKGNYNHDIPGVDWRVGGEVFEFLNINLLKPTDCVMHQQF